MKIGVVSDTHSRSIPRQLTDDFRDVEFIIHAGDFCSLKDYEIFQGYKEVKAVYGNMDEPKLREKLPERLIFAFEGFKIGIYHGRGPATRVLESVREEFSDERLDCVIFGHSHHPFNQVMNDVLYFNPGSPNDTVVAPYCSYGILEIKNNKLVGKIIKIKSENG